MFHFFCVLCQKPGQIYPRKDVRKKCAMEKRFSVCHTFCQPCPQEEIYRKQTDMPEMCQVKPISPPKKFANRIAVVKSRKTNLKLSYDISLMQS